MAEETKKTVDTAENEATPEKNQKTEKTEKKVKKTKKDLELEKLRAELDAAKSEIQSKNDLLARTISEFDNFKKRTEREKAGIAEIATAEVVKKLLPILDNIERASVLEDKTSPDYIKGIEMIVKQFETIGEKIGITEVAKIGDSFDPNFHEALMHIEDDTLGENVIAEILQKGYKIGETVVRAAMVKVAN